ncbi:MAG: hypothetical protein O3A47_09915 [Chloroflexi bacterium]|nr:hypothetical protein [Chloroflexota bacterium]
MKPTVTTGTVPEPRDATGAPMAETFPRLIFNSDGDIHIRSKQPWINANEFYRGLNELAGTPVDVYSYSINGGGDVYRHQSDVAPILGADMTDEEIEGMVDASHPGNNALGRVDVENTQMLLKLGMDPMVLLPKRAHELGMRFWASLRMNDSHDDFPGGAFWHGSFKKAHPELLIGSPYPGEKGGMLENDFTWAFNYAREEVRERQLAIIEETLSKYDVDGLELDFLRGGFYFRLGEAQLGMPLMTDFVRKVRALVSDIARRRCQSLTLAIRVDQTFELCEAKGLDARTWIKEELGDLFIPMSGGRLDMNADVRGFVEAVVGTSCKIAGGLVGSAMGYGHVPHFDTGIYRSATIEMLRAAAMSYYSQGASCIYTFNYDCQRFRGTENPYTDDELRALREVGDPALIARKNKRYAVTVDNRPEYSGEMESTWLQLPAALCAPGDQRTFTFYVGDDLAAAQRDGALKEVRLRLSIDGFSAPGDMVAVRLNRQELQGEESSWRPRALMYPGAPVKQGLNELVISLVKRREGAQTPLLIVGIEALIHYDSGW